jgi:hypothetical protein
MLDGKANINIILGIKMQSVAFLINYPTLVEEYGSDLLCLSY